MPETRRRTSQLSARFVEDLDSREQLSAGGEDFLFLSAKKPDERYLVGFARSPEAIREAFRLRYEVFNLELNEGLQRSHVDGLDRDYFDAQMTHLVLWDRQEQRVIGTYRLQTATHAMKHRGLYSSLEFDLTGLEDSFGQLVECGRACIARQHRSFRAVYLLWSGIACFLNVHAHSLLFGCCSLTTQDPDDGWRALQTIRRRNYLHPLVRVQTRPAFSCGRPEREFAPDLGEPLKLPKLFQAYMALGARVISPPALDREFGTIDFLVLLDTHAVHMSSLDLVR